MKFLIKRASDYFGKHPPCSTSKQEIVIDTEYLDPITLYSVELTTLPELIAIIEETNCRIVVGRHEEPPYLGRKIEGVNGDITIYDDYLE